MKPPIRVTLGILLIVSNVMAVGDLIAAGPSPVQSVVALLEVDRVANTGAILTRLLPVTVYRDSRYHDAAVIGDDASTVRGLADRSILNRVRDFSIYLRGERVGSIRVDELLPTQVSCTWTLAGLGPIRWRKVPSFATAEARVLATNQEVRRLRLYASSPQLAVQSFFASRAAVTESERRALIAVGKSLLKEAASRRYGSLQRVVPRGDVQLRGVERVDVDRDGRVEYIAEFEAPLDQPQVQWNPKPAIRLLVGASLKDASSSILLHLSTVFGYSDLSQAYSFETVLDVDGDGVGELLLVHGFYESARFEIFALRAGRLMRVFAGQKWGC